MGTCKAAVNYFVIAVKLEGRSDQRCRGLDELLLDHKRISLPIEKVSDMLRDGEQLVSRVVVCA